MISLGILKFLLVVCSCLAVYHNQGQPKVYDSQSTNGKHQIRIPALMIACARVDVSNAKW